MKVIEKVYKVELTEDEMKLIGSVMMHVKGGESIYNEIVNKIGLDELSEVYAVVHNEPFTMFKLEVK